MDRTELRKKIEEHLKFLEKSADYAVGANDYIGAAEISKQILETVKLLDEYS